MRSLLLVALESFRLLRRDRIFVPALFACALVAAFANLASEWSIEDFHKILIDIGFGGFHLAGSAVAIFWGVKTLADARDSGALEVQLAAPISRTSWLLGRYGGLAATLLLLGLVILAFWQTFMLLNDYDWMTRRELVGFAFLLLGWLVLAALAMFLATFCGQGVALFGTASLWVAGMATSLVAATLPPDAAASTRRVVATLARFWDLQQLNLVDFATGLAKVEPEELLLRGSYGLILIGILLTLAALLFHRRDAI